MSRWRCCSVTASAFITADQEVKKYIGPVRDLFKDLELVLLDGEEIVAAAWGFPSRGPGTSKTSPAATRARFDGQSKGTAAICVVTPSSSWQPRSGDSSSPLLCCA